MDETDESESGDVVLMKCDHAGCRSYLQLRHLPADPPTPRVVGPGDPIVTETDIQKVDSILRAHWLAAEALGWSMSVVTDRTFCTKHSGN